VKTTALPLSATIEVLADKGNGYTNSDSMRRQFVPGAYQIVHFENIDKLHAGSQAPLRLDPMNVPGILQIFSIRIVRDHDKQALYVAQTKEEFNRFGFSEGILSHALMHSLWLMAPHDDPQIQLPFTGDLGETSCTLEVVQKLHSTDVNLIGACCKFLESETEVRSALRIADAATGRLEKELQASREQTKELQLRITQLEENFAAEQKRTWWERLTGG
jgi:hypothetical protein